MFIITSSKIIFININVFEKKIIKKKRYRIVCEDDNNPAVVDATVSAETNTQENEQKDEEKSSETPTVNSTEKPEINPEDIVGYLGYGAYPNGWKKETDNTEFFKKMDEIIMKRKTANMNPDEQREAAKKILANADAFLKNFK